MPRGFVVGLTPGLPGVPGLPGGLGPPPGAFNPPSAAKALPTMTNALKRFVNAPSKPSYLSSASSPRFRFNQSLASSLFLFVNTRNPPKASRTPIIASITPSAKAAIPVSIFPPGTSF